MIWFIHSQYFDSLIKAAFKQNNKMYRSRARFLQNRLKSDFKPLCWVVFPLTGREVDSKCLYWWHFINQNIKYFLLCLFSPFYFQRFADFASMILLLKWWRRSCVDLVRLLLVFKAWFSKLLVFKSCWCSMVLVRTVFLV